MIYVHLKHLHYGRFSNKIIEGNTGTMGVQLIAGGNPSLQTITNSAEKRQSN